MTKVGKRVGRSVYVGYGAVVSGQSVLTDEQVVTVKEGAAWLPEDFRLHLVCVENNGTRCRYIELDSLYAPHPVATRSFIWQEGKKQLDKGVCRGNIYHRMDSILHPEHPRYPFYKAVTEYEVTHGLLGSDAPKGIGILRIWRAWVAQHMPWEDFTRDLFFIQTQHSGV